MEGKDEDNGKNKEQVDINEDDGSVYDTANGDETSSDMSEDDTTTDSSEDDEPLKKNKKKPKRCMHLLSYQAPPDILCLLLWSEWLWLPRHGQEVDQGGQPQGCQGEGQKYLKCWSFCFNIV